MFNLLYIHTGQWCTGRVLFNFIYFFKIRKVTSQKWPLNWEEVVPRIFSLPSAYLLPLWQASACYLYLWVWFCFVLFTYLFFLDSTYKLNHMVFVFLSDLLRLLKYLLGPSMLSQMAKCHSFSLLCVYILYLFYPFVYWWTSGLLPCLSCY